MEAERLNAEAIARHDEIIEGARRQAEAAQERARALEQRRQELLTELEGLRTSLSRMEGELDERRTKLNLSAADEEEPPARVVRPETEARQDWEPGETVRVVRARKGARRATPITDPEQVVEEVRKVRAATTEAEPASTPPPATETAPVEASTTTAIESTTAETSPADEVGDIFSRLRGKKAVAAVATAPRPEPEAEASTPPPPPAPVKKAAKRLAETDPLELRQRLLIPVSNRALRNLKRQLTEIQNDALEELRVAGPGWRPERKALEEQLRPDLVVLLAESFSMGHTAAEELVGKSFPRPPTPARDEAGAMVVQLIDQLEQVLAGADEDAGREVATSVSRVFRAWRTDEAERRVADLASSAYHRGLRATLSGGRYPLGWVVAGRGCVRCRQAGEEAELAEDSGPPLHAGCGCTLVPLAG
jgi:hypothetical protein